MRELKYSENYPNEVISLMETGLSITACAGALGVCRDTFYDWEKTYPDFGQALKIGRAKRLLFWERNNLDAAKPNSGINPTPGIFALKNADNEEWRDRREVAIPQLPESGIDDLAIAHRIAFLLLAAQPKAKIIPTLLTDESKNGTPDGE